MSLGWSKDGELNTVLRHQVKALNVYGGLRQPHTFGRAAETEMEIGDAPDDLRALIA